MLLQQVSRGIRGNVEIKCAIICEHLLHIGIVPSFVGELRSHGINSDTKFRARYVGRGKERCGGGGT